MCIRDSLLVELAHKNDLGLALFIGLRKNNHSTLYELGPLAHEDLVESPHDLALPGGRLTLQPQAPLLLVLSLDEYLAKSFDDLPVIGILNDVDGFVMIWNIVCFEGFTERLLDRLYLAEGSPDFEDICVDGFKSDELVRHSPHVVLVVLGSLIEELFGRFACIGADLSVIFEYGFKSFSFLFLGLGLFLLGHVLSLLAEIVGGFVIESLD